MEYLITGGAGFIGSHLAEALLKSGKDVRILDNFCSGRWENIEEAAGIKIDQRDKAGQFLSAYGARLEVIPGDLRNQEVLLHCLNGVSYILHHAAVASVDLSISDPVTCNQINVDGTLSLLVQAGKAGIKRFIYAGSASAYGLSPTLPKNEEMKPEPVSPYAVSKLAGEDYCRVFSSLYQLPTVILRYFNVFGPRQDPLSDYASVIPRFIELIVHHETPTIFGDGEQTRDFVYIDNVIKANMLALEVEGISGETFNIGCGHQISLNDMIKELNRILQKVIKPAYTHPRPGDIKYSVADISKASDKLGYLPQIGFAEGLEKTVHYFSSKG